MAHCAESYSPPHLRLIHVRQDAFKLMNCAIRYILPQMFLRCVLLCTLLIGGKDAAFQFGSYCFKPLRRPACDIARRVVSNNRCESIPRNPAYQKLVAWLLNMPMKSVTLVLAFRSRYFALTITHSTVRPLCVPCQY